MCLERVRTRRGHGFTDLTATEHMWQEFHRAEIGARHVMHDHDVEPVEIARAVAARVATGEIVYP